MDCKTELESELVVLKRIIALLFGLADLAERATRRSYPVRCLVLWALRRAEPVARRYVTGSECDGEDMRFPSAAEPPASVHHRNSPAEAMHMAAVLRTLACALADQLHFARRISRWWNDASACKTATPGLEPEAQPKTSPSGRAENSGVQGPKRRVPAHCASTARRHPQTGFT